MFQKVVTFNYIYTDLFFKWQNNLSRNTNQIHLDLVLQSKRTKLLRAKAFYQLWNFHFFKSSLNAFTVLIQRDPLLKAHYKVIVAVFVLSDEYYLKWQCISVKHWCAPSISKFLGNKVVENPGSICMVGRYEREKEIGSSKQFYFIFFFFMQVWRMSAAKYWFPECYKSFCFSNLS